MGILSRTLKTITGTFVWRGEHRRVQLLLSFARTEAGSAVDIARAAHGIASPELTAHLRRHVADEDRHAALFRRRAREVFGNAEGRTPLPDPVSRDLMPLADTAERGALTLTDHGFLPSDSFKDLGEVGYIAMLYVAELAAAEDFRVHRRVTARCDPQTSEVFRQILRDEEYHVAYTRDQLHKWEKQGRAAEVRRALRRMRWLRRKTELLHYSQRLGELMGTLMLTALYCTVFVPFGLAGRFSRRSTGWVAASRRPGVTVEGLRSPA
jgi:hypothetical protein